MKSIQLVWFLLLFFFTQSLVAQNTAAVEYYRAGEIALLEEKPKKALRSFKRAIKENPDLAAAYRGMGVACEMLNEYEQAVNHYEEVLAIDSMFSRLLYFQLGEVYYKIGESERALELFKKYKDLQEVDLVNFSLNGDKEVAMEEEVVDKVDGNIRAVHITLDPERFKQIEAVENLGPAINSGLDEVFPFLSNDQMLLFFTQRNINRNDENLLFSEWDNGRWKKGSSVGSSFNTGSPEGMSTFVRDGKLMYFTACQRETVMGYCDIWEAQVEGTSIRNVKALNGDANSPRWESQPSISCDGSTLYFASKREGGYGGTDIWYSNRDADGYWSRPKNLGPRINTSLDEEAPFITNDGQALYFSSTGHLGMGEQDIFVSYLDENGIWGEPQNLGPPVNTAYREFGFFLSADARTGYFASNRPEGEGGMDIYKFQLTEGLYAEPITYAEGYVTDSLTREGLSTKVFIDGREAVKTTQEGRFFLCVPAKDTLRISVKVDQYLPYYRTIAIPDWDNRNFFPINIKMRPIRDLQPKSPPPPPKDTIAPPRIRQRKHYTHTILFEFDSDQVSPDEFDKLVDFVDKVAEKEILRIEIIGYADDVGTEQYNLELSENRAKKIGLYMIERGIPSDQLYREGRGEVVNNRPKEENRKVELKIYTIE
jgi:outer membrane protein OmpA-like peptidoglycan-associated protein/tetratricopeptide (TPR) repeat protein